MMPPLRIAGRVVREIGKTDRVLVHETYSNWSTRILRTLPSRYARACSPRRNRRSAWRSTVR